MFISLTLPFPIPKLNHSNTYLYIVWILNGFGNRMFGIRASTVIFSLQQPTTLVCDLNLLRLIFSDHECLQQPRAVRRHHLRVQQRPPRLCHSSRRTNDNTCRCHQKSTAGRSLDIISVIRSSNVNRTLWLTSNMYYISVLIFCPGQLGSPEKCTSRLEGNKRVSNLTNLIHVSNKYYHKYYCVNLVLSGKPIS